MVDEESTKPYKASNNSNSNAYELSNIIGYRSIGPTAKLLLAASYTFSIFSYYRKAAL